MDVPSVTFDHHKACKRPVEVRRVRFDHHKACMKYVEVQMCGLTITKRVGGM